MMAYDPRNGSEILSKADRIIARWRALYLNSVSYDREEISMAKMCGKAFEEGDILERSRKNYRHHACVEASRI